MKEHHDCCNTILVVDDTPANLEIILELLSSFGYDICTVNSGERALKLLQTYCPDLILLDVQMPGMDGFETCRRIKANVDTANIPIMFLTVFSDTEKIITGFSLGAVDYITKPFKDAELLARVRTHLQLHSLTQNLEQRVLERTAELKALEARQRKLFDASPIGLALLSMNGSLVDVNAAYAAIIGRTIPETLTLSSWDIIPSSYHADEQLQLENLKKTGRGGPYQKEYLHKDGHLVPVRLSSIIVEQDGESFIWSSVEDISDRKEAELLIQRHLRTIEASIDGISILRGERYVFLNKSQLALFGYDHPDEILGKSWHPLYQDDEIERLEQEVFPHVRQQGHWRGETLGKRRDGTLVPAEISLTLTPGGDIIQVCRDISERRRHEAERQHNEARIRQSLAQLEASNYELESFAYSISHDLRAPLRAINGFSQSLLEDYAGLFDEEGQYFFDRIRVNSNRMGDLIDDLLRLSRVSRSDLHYTTVDLSALANEVLHDLQASEPDRQVEIIVQPGAIVIADAALMRVVMVNLLQNAWKFTRHHPTARIEFGVLPRDSPASSTPIYFIKDDGAGFNMTYSNKLFGVFQRLHSINEFPGTGIGLASVRRAIHRHGGKVWAEAAVEQGTTLFFTMPIQPKDI